MFLEAQGYDLKENVLYQDNQSPMRIIVNGKNSSGQKTKHMDNRYFWIKDRLKSEHIMVKYFPTDKMIADFFTQPLQGNLFRKFRDVVMEYVHISSLYYDLEELLLQEGVEKDEKDIFHEYENRPNDDPSSITLEMNVTWADVVKGKKNVDQEI